MDNACRESRNRDRTHRRQTYDSKCSLGEFPRVQWPRAAERGDECWERGTDSTARVSQVHPPHHCLSLDPGTQVGTVLDHSGVWELLLLFRCSKRGPAWRCVNLAPRSSQPPLTRIHPHNTFRQGVCVHAKWLQSHPILWDPMDGSPPGSSENQRIEAIELWCWRLLRVPWTARRSNQSILKESVLNIGRTDAEARILWPPDVKNWLIGKDPDAGKDWRQEKKGTTEGEMVGWHHQLDGHEFENTQELVMDRKAWCTAVDEPQSVRHDWATELNQGFSVHGICQARILEWVAISFSWGSSRPRDQTRVSRLLHWQAGSLALVPPGKPPKGFSGFEN